MRYPFLLTLSLLLSFPSAALAQDYATTRKSIQGFYGFSVNSFSGNLHYSRNDLFVPGRGLSLDFTFYYNSSESSDNFGSGLGWSHSYDMTMSEDSMGVITLRRAGGRSHQYTRVGGDIVSAQGVYDEVDEPSPGVFRLTSKNGMEYHFEGMSHPGVTRIRDRFGNEMTLSYEDGHLASVTDVGGRTAALTYNDDGLVTEIRMVNTDPERWVYYGYEGEYLTSVTDAEGYQLIYGYTGGRLTSMQDKNGNPLNIGYSPYGAVTAMRTCSGEKKFDYNSTLSTTSVVEKVRDTYQKTSYVFENGRLIEEIGNCCASRKLYEYDVNGNLSRLTNALGQEALFYYDNRGNMIQEINALGVSRIYTYSDQLNLVTSISDWNGNLTNLYYDAMGRLDSIQMPLGLSEHYLYDGHGQLVEHVDARGGTSQYQYDDFGNTVQEVNPIGGVRSLMYDDLGQLIGETDEDGYSVGYTYDGVGNQTAFIHPDGEVALEYDGNQNVIREVDELGVGIDYGYDEFNRQILEVDTLGNLSLLELDQLGNVVMQVDADGAVTRFRYDAMNHIVETEINEEVMAGYEYDVLGNPIGYLNSVGHHSSMTYDALNRLVSVSDSMGVVVELSYDGNGNVTQVIDGVGAVTTQHWDEFNRMVERIDGQGESVLYEYSGLSEVKGVTDQNGRSVSIEYDAHGNAVLVRNALNEEIQLEYTLGGMLAAVTDAGGNRTELEYNWRGDVTKQVSQDGAEVEWLMDSRGLLKEQSFSGVDTIYFDYDLLGRNTQQVATSGDSLLFEYDELSRLVGSRSMGFDLSCAYDVFGNVVSESQGENIVLIDYDNGSNTRTLTYPSGKRVTERYDGRYQLKEVVDGLNSDRRLLVQEFDGAGRVTSKSMPQIGVDASIDRDFVGRVMAMTYSGEDDVVIGYQRDAKGLVTNRTINGLLNSTSTFEYDELDRLIGVVSNGFASGEESYDYDASGNIVQQAINGALMSFNIGPANIVMSSSSGGDTLGLVYDHRGNLLFDGVWSYAYDGFSRLVQMSNDTMSFGMRYDALNRVVSEWSSQGDTAIHIYEGFNRIETMDSDGLTSFIHDGIQSVLLVENEGGVIYSLDDELGTPLFLCGEGGLISGSRQYSAYGVALYDKSIETSLMRKIPSFGGKNESIGGVGLLSLARHLSPVLGRFFQRDPLGLVDGLNTYVYAGGNPVNQIDAFGLASSKCSNPKCPEPFYPDELGPGVNSYGKYLESKKEARNAKRIKRALDLIKKQGRELGLESAKGDPSHYYQGYRKWSKYSNKLRNAARSFGKKVAGLGLAIDVGEAWTKKKLTVGNALSMAVGVVTVVALTAAAVKVGVATAAIAVTATTAYGILDTAVALTGGGSVGDLIDKTVRRAKGCGGDVIFSW